MFVDYTYIILIPAVILSFYAQSKIKSTYSKYSRVLSKNGYTGAQVARIILDNSGLYNVPIEVINGELTDHYDPSRKVMRLSQDVYYGTSVASIGVAAHETGHAIQDKVRYSPMILRGKLVPYANIGSNGSWVLFLLGIFFGIPSLVNIGILLFSLVVLFQLVTLPVEFDASRRAMNILEGNRVLYSDEIPMTRKVLSAAALTYVASALMAILQLVRLLIISRNSRD